MVGHDLWCTSWSWPMRSAVPGSSSAGLSAARLCGTAYSVGFVTLSRHGFPGCHRGHGWLFAPCRLLPRRARRSSARTSTRLCAAHCVNRSAERRRPMPVAVVHDRPTQPPRPRAGRRASRLPALDLSGSTTDLPLLSDLQRLRCGGATTARRAARVLVDDPSSAEMWTVAPWRGGPRTAAPRRRSP